MTKNNKDRPPIIYLFQGLGAFLISFTLLRTIKLGQFGEHGFQVLVGFFGLTFLVLEVLLFKKLFEKLRNQVV